VDSFIINIFHLDLIGLAYLQTLFKTQVTLAEGRWSPLTVGLYDKILAASGSVFLERTELKA
jgi:hypothetical protein